jgi:hypothetical protein
MGKNSFVLYDDEYDFIKLLSFEERGKLLTAIFEHRLFGEVNVSLSEAGAMLFQVIKNHLDRDAQKYIDKCEKSKQAIESRWNKNNTNEYERIRTNTKHTDTDNDNDNVNDNELPKGNNTKTTKTKTTICNCIGDTTQLELDINRYFAKRGYVSNALDFIAYNESRNWKGIGGEDVKNDYTRYADRWEADERRKRGESDWEPPII